MKKLFSLILMGLVMCSSLPQHAFAEEVTYQDNPIDQMSDWAATIGKDKNQRDQIIAQRKVERQRKHMEKKAAQMKKQAEKQSKQLGKDAEKAQKDVKKSLGF